MKEKCEATFMTLLDKLVSAWYQFAGESGPE